ncbi:exosortase Y-associated Wzy-like protein [Pedobacter sp.]
MPSNKAKYFLFFVPFVISFLLSGTPVISFFVAWLGSFYIFYLTWLSPHRIVKKDLSISHQIMRPIFLLQLIFAGFMCCTSIFYFIDHLGYEYFEKVDSISFVVNEETYLIAKCQRLALLAHTALVCGILMAQQSRQKKRAYEFHLNRRKNIIWLRIGIASYLLTIVMQFLPGLFQFSIYLSNIAIFCASLLLLKGLRSKDSIFIIYGATMFGVNFINATLTGYKEHIIVNVIILFALLFPYYKRLITVLAIPSIYFLLYILPTYANIIRQQSWSGDKSAEEARSEAFETIFQEDNSDQIVETNWSFLTNRFSEIGMFTQFVNHVPEKRDFYGWEIIENSFLAIIPRVFYPNKPVTEKIAMQRVYDAGVADERSSVSAKTRPVVDAYLSFGYFGVLLFLFALGYTVQFFNNTAERWFGGYEFGCIVMFNACFQTLWRGNNFEFMINNMFYGFITMWLMFVILRKMQILVRKH